jgi:hypothetical protein
LGAFVVDPPTVPKTTVAVAAIFLVNPPVPVRVNPVAVAIDNTVAAAVVLVSVMLPVPKAIARVLVLLELKIPVLSVNPAKLIVPAVNVKVPAVVQRVGLPDSVRVISALLTVVLKETAVAATVTVAAAPELASKVAVSAAVGTPALPTPPESDAQWVVVALSQVPDPPTQK